MRRLLVAVTCVTIWYGLVLLLVPTRSDEGGVPALPLYVRSELIRHFLRVQKGDTRFGDLPATIGSKWNRYHLVVFADRDRGATVLVAYPAWHTEYAHGLLYRVAFLNSAKRHYQSFLLRENGTLYTSGSRSRFDERNPPGLQDVVVKHNQHWGGAVWTPDLVRQRGPSSNQPPATSESGY